MSAQPSTRSAEAAGDPAALPGRLTLRPAETTGAGAARPDYFLFQPENVDPARPPLVVVHGISRNAHEQAGVFSTLCDARSVVLVVPILYGEQHRDYQRLGRMGRGNRSDRLLHRFLAEAGSLTGADVSQFYLFGFSGGAQFAHRYVMAHPHRVLGAVIAAAGWYTMPTTARRFPYGLRPCRELKGLQAVFR